MHIHIELSVYSTSQNKSLCGGKRRKNKGKKKRIVRETSKRCFNSQTHQNERAAFAFYNGTFVSNTTDRMKKKKKKNQLLSLLPNVEGGHIVVSVYSFALFSFLILFFLLVLLRIYSLILATKIREVVNFSKTTKYFTHMRI